MEWVNKEYSIHEQMVFGKIKGTIFATKIVHLFDGDSSLLVKLCYSFHFSSSIECVVLVAEGVVMAITHPGIAAGSATLAGIVLFKSNMFSCNFFSL